MLHILEPGGRGGVYQHTLALAAELAASDRLVTIHTARDAELTLDDPRVTTCRCMRWERRGPGGIRQASSLAWVFGRLLPHLVAVAHPRDEWEVQGLFGRGAYLACLAVLRLRGVSLTFAPHNDFSRTGNPLQRRAIRLAERLASTIVVFGANSARDRRARGATVLQRPLTQYVPGGWEDWLPFWRARWGERPVVLFAGQLRMDKNPLELIAACDGVAAPHLLAFVGEDKGAKSAIEQEAAQRRLDIDLMDGYLDLPQFAAALACSAVVVCPYRVASQSGVLALARALGTPTVAVDVGNLGEQADHTYAPGDGDALRQAIERALAERAEA